MKRLYAIVGHPVRRSFSPAMHNAAFAAAGLPHTYMPVAVRPGALPEGMRLLQTLGVHGANVTLPHKVDIVPLLTEVHGEAAIIRSVNTLIADGDGYAGHSTDGPGFLSSLADEGIQPASALILGAGGAARAVAYALAATGVPVKVAARRAEQAADVASLHENLSPVRWEAPGQAELYVNATPLRSGLPELKLNKRSVVVDLIYGTDTEILAHAREAGAQAHDGRGMLLHQAALSWTIWTGLPAPFEAMSEALTAVAAAAAKR